MWRGFLYNYKYVLYYVLYFSLGWSLFGVGEFSYIILVWKECVGRRMGGIWEVLFYVYSWFFFVFLNRDFFKRVIVKMSLLFSLLIFRNRFLEIVFNMGFFFVFGFNVRGKLLVV